MKILIILIRFNKVGYIYDPDSSEKIEHYLLPVGLAYISAYLKAAGKDVHVLNLNNREGKINDIIRTEMTLRKYDIVFTGGLSLFYPHLRDLVKIIRHHSPQTTVVVGGGIISAQPEIMFKLIEPDFGVIGEGEETCLELVNTLELGTDIGNVTGLVYYGWNVPGGKMIPIINNPRKPIMDLDAMPFPDYESFGYEDYLRHISPADYIAYDIVDEPRYYPIVASRSCPANCTFCFHPLGKVYRQRSVDNIMLEIKANVEKYRINIIFTLDELLSNDRDRMVEFCQKFKAYSDTLPYKLWFVCNNRVDTTTEEMLMVMKESGAYLLSFGLESYSQTVLTSMKKHTTPEQINKIVHLMRKHKLGLQGSFIFGDVAETCETAKETLDFLKENIKLVGAGVSPAFIIPFQGTPIYKQCVREGKIPDEIKFIESREKEGYKFLEPMNMTSLSDKDFARLKEEVYSLHLAETPYSIPLDEYLDGNDTYTSVRCPDCGQVSMFKNIPTPKGFNIQNVGCRHCMYRFIMVSKWYPYGRAILKALGFRRVYWIHNLFKL